MQNKDIIDRLAVMRNQAQTAIKFMAPVYTTGFGVDARTSIQEVIANIDSLDYMLSKEL